MSDGFRLDSLNGAGTVAALKYQMTDQLRNQFGGHGFTGLNYIHHRSSEAEIQRFDPKIAFDN